jgi:hypothetical protein
MSKSNDVETDTKEILIMSTRPLNLNPKNDELLSSLTYKHDHVVH